MPLVLRRFLLSLALLSALPLPAATGHAVSPFVYGSSPSGPSEVLVASNGSTFLAVWASGPSAVQRYVFASLMDADGRLMTPEAKLIIASANAMPLQVLSAGRNYVVTWSDADYSTQVTIVTPELEVLRTFTLPASSSGRLGANGDRLLYVAVPDQTSATALMLDLEGNVLRRAMMMRDRVPNSGVADVVAEDDGFAVLFRGAIGLAVQRIGLEGDVKPAVTILPPSRSGRQPGTTAIASRNGVLFVAWTLVAPVVPPEVLRAAIVDRNDHVSAAQDIPVNGSAVQLVAVERSAAGFRLFAHAGEWPSGTRLQLSSWQIGLAGESFTTVPVGDVPEGPSRSISDVAVNGDAVVAAGSDFVLDNGYPSGGRAIAFRIDRPAAEAEVLSIVPRQQIAPATSTDGLDFFVAWPESTARSNVLAHARVGRDALPKRWSDDASLAMRWPSRPAVAFGGSLYLAVWNDGGDLAAATIFPSGAVWQRFVIRKQVVPVEEPAVVWDGRRFAVAWIENGAVYGTLVGLDGSVTEPRQWAPPMQDEYGVNRFSSRPAIAWNGSSFLIGWATFYGGIICGCASPPPDVYVRLVNANGVPFGNVRHLSRGSSAIHLASNGAGFAAVLEEIDSVNAALIDVKNNELVSGTATPIFRWIDAPASSVAFDGIDYVIALRYGIWFAPGKSWVAVTRLNRFGIVSERRFTALEQTALRESPAIAANGEGDVLLAASAVRPEVGSPRVYTFLESELDPLPAAPPSPTVVNATRYSCGPNWSYPCGKTVITWSGTSSDAGYVIEAHGIGSGFYFARYAAAGATSTTLDWPAEAVRVRAFGPGGLSEPSEPMTVIDPARRRSAGR